MKDFTDQELKKASILDFTDDLDLMRKAMDDDSFETSEVSMWGEREKILSLVEYAEYTKNSSLEKRLKKLFEDELGAIFNE